MTVHAHLCTVQCVIGEVVEFDVCDGGGLVTQVFVPIAEMCLFAIGLRSGQKSTIEHDCVDFQSTC